MPMLTLADNDLIVLANSSTVVLVTLVLLRLIEC